MRSFEESDLVLKRTALKPQTWRTPAQTLAFHPKTFRAFRAFSVEAYISTPLRSCCYPMGLGLSTLACLVILRKLETLFPNPLTR